jgi:hypothetical protein
MPSPLNPLLFNRLKEEFGYVKISHPGCAASSISSTDPFSNRINIQFTSSGEYYVLSCPYCGDRRCRLWIAHLWGVPDERTGSKNLWLAICYNSDCLSVQGRAQELYDRVYGFKNANLRGQPLVILPGEIEEHVLKEVKAPGLLIRVDKLPITNPACSYLSERGYDIKELGEKFNISLCVDTNDYPMGIKSLAHSNYDE